MDSVPVQDVLGEFVGLVLPDKRLIDRVRDFAAALGANPGASLPQLLTVAQLEGTYRLLGNERVCLEALHRPHRQRTIERCLQQASVVVVHDTTTVLTPWADPSEVGYLSTGKTGYLAHASLAVGIAPGRPVQPIGVLNVEPVFRTKRANSRKPKGASGAETARWKDKEFERWQRGIQSSAEALENYPSVIHVMDREADCYALFSLIEELGNGFVIRLRLDRRAREVSEHADEEPEWSRLGALAAEMEGLCARDVPLSKRGDKRAPASLKTHPPRESRCARLHFSARQVEIAKPKWSIGPASMTLGLVRVWEPEPPEGEEPVEWLLITNEPCETPDEVVRVVDLYRCRWIIEEFFKVLKSGCALEKRQFESRTALLNILAIMLPIAVHLLWIRSCARDTPDAPATDVFTPLQLTVLRQLSPRKMPETPNAREALWVLAGLGGHIPNNGWPGWQVLGRAYVKLIDAVKVWQLAMAVAATDGAAVGTRSKM